MSIEQWWSDPDRVQPNYW